MKHTEFPHIYNVRVRTHDVDSQGIVHNMNYLKYFEEGRVEYLRELGYVILKSGIFNNGLKVVVVRNEIDYLSSAYLDNLLHVHTRISWIKNSSFCFEQIITETSSGNIICKGKGILVSLNTSNLPEIISNKIISEIENFEKRKIKHKNDKEN